MKNGIGNGINGVVKTMFEHPIASFFLIDVTLSGVAGIIRACKGTNNAAATVVDAVKETISEADN